MARIYTVNEALSRVCLGNQTEAYWRPWSQPVDGVMHDCATDGKRILAVQSHGKAHYQTGAEFPDLSKILPGPASGVAYCADTRDLLDAMAGCRRGPTGIRPLHLKGDSVTVTVNAALLQDLLPWVTRRHVALRVTLAGELAPVRIDGPGWIACLSPIDRKRVPRAEGDQSLTLERERKMTTSQLSLDSSDSPL